jgi:hypothetical protein
MRLDGRQLVRGDRFFGRDFVVVRQAPTFRAGTFASPAPDAQGAVVEDCFRHIKTPNSVLAEIDLNV